MWTFLQIVGAVGGIVFLAVVLLLVFAAALLSNPNSFR